MREWQSQSHVRRYCRYHVVWVPKYRKRAIFGEMRRGVGRIVRELCQRHGVELVEGHALPDHVHVLLGIPPKLSVAHTVGFLKGKSAIRIHREYLGRQRNFTRLGGRLVIQDGHLIITAATASGAALPPLVVDLTVTGAWVRWRQQSSTRLGQAAAAYVGDDGVSRGAVSAGDADTVPMRRLPTTYPSREEAAGAATQALADAETADAELELRLPFTPDAHVLHPVVLEAVPAALRAVLAALPPRWTLHQVRHQLGSRAAATTTLTCRPAPAQTPAVIDHPPLAATPLPLGPGPLTLPGPAVPHPPHRLAIVQQVAAETGYPRSGLSATAFTQRVAERLHAEDARWGRRVNSTGPISDDTVAYQIGDSPHNPFSVDIILGAGGPTPRLHWVPHGRIGGTWIAP